MIYIYNTIIIINYISIIHQLQFNLTTLNKTSMSQNYGEAKHWKVRYVLDNDTSSQGCYNLTDTPSLINYKTS